MIESKIFSEELNEAVVQETLRWFLASKRRGTHSAKTRAEVSGGGVKPWRQKGTGRARAGSIRSPLWRKGGVIFPPKPRDYSYALPIKIRKKAMRVVLSELYRNERVKLVEKFSLAEPKTKAAIDYLKELNLPMEKGKLKEKVLFILAGETENFARGIRNLDRVELTTLECLNIYDLLHCDWLIMEKRALAQLEARLT